MADDSRVPFSEPGWFSFLTESTRSAPLWLILRIWLGWQWYRAGISKVLDPAWTGPDAGTALRGFLNNAILLGQGPRPDVQPWYAMFLEKVALPNAGIFAYAVAYGELLVGVALIVGALTGIAAFFGSFMNMSYLLAGTVSTNPILFTVALGIMLAWRVSGWYGLDRWLLPALGTPWEPGYLFERPDP